MQASQILFCAVRHQIFSVTTLLTNDRLIMSCNVSTIVLSQCITLKTNKQVILPYLDVIIWKIMLDIYLYRQVISHLK